MEAEHIGILMSEDPWCNIQAFESVLARGLWQVSLDEGSVVGIREHLQQMIVEEEFKSTIGARASHVGSELAAASSRLLHIPRKLAAKASLDYILRLGEYLAIYRASDPVTTPQIGSIDHSSDHINALNALSSLRLSMREKFEECNSRFNLWLVERLQRDCGLSHAVALSLSRLMTLDELLSYQELGDLHQILGRKGMLMLTSKKTRIVSALSNSLEVMHEAEVARLSSVGAITDPVIGRLYDLRANDIGDMPVNSIILVQTLTPQQLRGRRDIAAVIALEGGYTSHAALVARELGVPCVISTGWDEELLELNGDVEVDPRIPSIKRVL